MFLSIRVHPRGCRIDGFRRDFDRTDGDAIDSLLMLLDPRPAISLTTS